MKQSKYIPGDWVKASGHLCKVEEVFVNRFTKEYEYTLVYPNGNSSRIVVGEIEPVPLTSEILDNNRWRRLKSRQYTWWKARFDGVYYFIKPNKDYPSVWELCRGKDRRRFEKIRYVHQLQHFLFGLGLNSEMNLEV